MLLIKVFAEERTDVWFVFNSVTLVPSLASGCVNACLESFRQGQRQAGQLRSTCGEAHQTSADDARERASDMMEQSCYNTADVAPSLPCTLTV